MSVELIENTAEPNQEETTKPQKKTAEIRALLEGYIKYQKRIDNTEERLANLESTLGAPSSSNLSGMPSGSRDRTSKQERDYLKKEELEEKLEEMYLEENRRREEIEGLIEQMEEPDEQTVIEMRYIDDANWRTISVALHGKLADYDEHEDRYLKRTFKIHGRALQTLARIYSAEPTE